jgi:guanylate kinase
MFKKPTLVSLTAPSCAGKNYLLEAMLANGYGRIVGTTDRAPRHGEIEGVHYFFLSTEESINKYISGEFAEHVIYNGTRYGITHVEMAQKMSLDHPPVVILEPSGVSIYREYCHAHGWDMFTIFIDTPEEVRIERLTQRTTQDILQVTLPLHTSMTSDVHKVVQANNHRLQAILLKERAWAASNNWDVIVDGTNVELALEIISKEREKKWQHV